MGLVALLLASMGIYGVTAYTVALRRREFAIRLALGAPRARVVRMAFRQSMWLVAFGLAIGLTTAIGAGQALAVFFFGLPATHIPTLLGTIVLFVGIGVMASIVPRPRQSATAGGRRFKRANSRSEVSGPQWVSPRAFQGDCARRLQRREPSRRPWARRRTASRAESGPQMHEHRLST
jgi:predicted lysophospholipase L1 biosynthesis ABC-type transport system permease subunit